MSTVKTTQKTAGFAAVLADKLPALIAVTTVTFAVCATLASFKAAGYGNKMVLAQNQASDQWAFYQAKSLKENIYQTQHDVLEIEMHQAADPQPYQEMITRYDQEIQRYKREKDDISNDAKAKEKERDKAKQLNTDFGQALIFLQIGILLSSLASINKTCYYWYGSIIGGGIGIILLLIAFSETL